MQTHNQNRTALSRFIEKAKNSLFKKSYSLTDITALLALVLSLYQFYQQNVKQAQEEFMNKFGVIREATKTGNLSNQFLVKELVRELDTKQHMKEMTDVQKEVLSLGYGFIGNYKRSFEISKSNILSNLRTGDYEAAYLFYSDFQYAALRNDSVRVLRKVYRTLDSIFTAQNNFPNKKYLNGLYSIGMLEYAVAKNDLSAVLSYMTLFMENFDANLYNFNYPRILGYMNPEMRDNEAFVNAHKLLLEKNNSSEINYNTQSKIMVAEMAKVFGLGNQTQQ